MKLPNSLFGILTILFVFLFQFSCSKEDTPSDPCATVACTAPLICVNGNCVCPAGYSGDDCTEELMPKTVTIKEFKLTEFPVADGLGDPWDPNSAPDLVVFLVYEGNVLKTSSIIKDANLIHDHVFNLNWQLDANLTNNHLFFIEDDDSPDANDIIGGVSFHPYQNGLDFPEKIELYNEDPNNPVRGEITLSYSF